ncbi:hypothetical protein [Halocatena pleomorpha]|uniref:hypothetical protein n=1 Tax=Halocatena pleomorpha TaxID=1785090 RepID=UPI00163A4033|nr:hypothetical protein [Halocatena pleomorpha]
MTTTGGPAKPAGQHGQVPDGVRWMLLDLIEHAADFDWITTYEQTIELLDAHIDS